jgi:uracil-DNA glycosylase
MTEDNLAPLDENTRRYYLDAMGIQCWEMLDALQPQNDHGEMPGAEHVEGQTVKPVTESSNKEVAAINWSQLEAAVKLCDQCALHKSRMQALPGRGNPSAKLLLLLLAPNARDDESGVICSAELDELLGKMLAAIDIDINDVYISSLLKCAVPVNHTVSVKEIRSCKQHLTQQIRLIQPEFLVVLGETAARCLLQKNLPIDDMRAMNPGMSDQGQPYQVEEIPVFISYSPHELILQPAHKRAAWADLQQLQKLIQSQDK